MADNKEEEAGFDENEAFGYNDDLDLGLREQEAEDEDLEEYDGIGADAEGAEASEDKDTGEEEESEEESLFGEEKKEEEEEDSEFTDTDLASFNKKLNKEFKTTQELKDFLNKGDEAVVSVTEDQEYDKAQGKLEMYEPLLELGHEELMRKEFETIAVQKNKDLNDEDVQEDIEEQLEKLRDTNQMDLRAERLRDILRNKIIEPAKAEKAKIEQARTQRQADQEKSSAEETQNALAEIFNNKNFFGLKPDRETVNKVYQDIKTGKILEDLKSDKKLLAEVAMMRAYKEQIYKKASGLTYNDGMKAILDDYKTQSSKQGSSITKAQKRGSSTGGDESRGLLSSILK